MTERVIGNWKQPRSRKLVRGEKRKKRDRTENENKQKVRSRDGFCRFPACGCRSFMFRNHVAHLEHKGAGGDPTGERSLPAGMILLCPPRHRENVVALDRGTVRIDPIDAREGTAGPCRFYVDFEIAERLVQKKLPRGFREVDGNGRAWFLFATERARHVLEPMAECQRVLGVRLARMEL